MCALVVVNGGAIGTGCPRKARSRARSRAYFTLRSLRTRPSTRSITRSHRSAMRGSCVTTRNAVPSSRLKRRRSSNTSFADLGVEVAGGLVGQDQRRTARRARARWRRAAAGLPRASSSCSSCGPRGRPRRAAPWRAPRIAGDGVASSPQAGSITFSSAVNAGRRWWNWNTKPSVRARSSVSPRSSRPVVSVPVEDHATARRTIEQTDDVEQRALARARRTDQRGELAALELEVDAVERARDGAPRRSP